MSSLLESVWPSSVPKQELDIRVPAFLELILLFSNSSGEYEAIIKMDWESVLNRMFPDGGGDEMWYICMGICLGVGRVKVCVIAVSLALRLIVSSTTNCAAKRDHAGLCSGEPNFIFSRARAQRYGVYNYKLPSQGPRLLR